MPYASTSTGTGDAGREPDPSGLARAGYPDGMSADRRYGDQPERDERVPTAQAAPRRDLPPAAAQFLALQGTAGNRALSADGRGTTDLVADDRDAGGAGSDLSASFNVDDNTPVGYL